MPGIQCVSEVYTGQACSEQLTTSQQCTLSNGPKEQIMVNDSGQQQQIEHAIANFVNILCELLYESVQG